MILPSRSRGGLEESELPVNLSTILGTGADEEELAAACLGVDVEGMSLPLAPPPFLLLVVVLLCTTVTVLPPPDKNHHV